MKISQLFINNFKSVKHLSITDMDNALILVGKNSTGKTVILDALRAVSGLYTVQKEDFRRNHSNVEIGVTLSVSEEDLRDFHSRGILSRYRNYERWLADFKEKFPGYQNDEISFIYTVNQNGACRFQDEFSKNNRYIPQILPRFFFLDHTRDIKSLQEELHLSFASKDLLQIREKKCVFDRRKDCQECFQCIGKIQNKPAGELGISELVRLLQFQLSQSSNSAFAEILDDNFYKNSGFSRHLKAEYRLNTETMFEPLISVLSSEGEIQSQFDDMSAGMKSLYMLSLLESYVEDNQDLPFVIMIEDPELFLHPTLQKNACEILSGLSKKNQVIFSTHSPNMIFNFNSRQVRQVVLDRDNNTIVNPDTKIDVILDDLGYGAEDMLNVSFVFFVEGKQDRSRLPLLLNRYYSELQDSDGQVRRISIITTNSCTNIKTYANLKYINQLYIKDSFLMIRDSDGKDKNMLRSSLCKYYNEDAVVDRNYLPRVLPRNVLILKYYSFENYFLDPKVMTAIGVLKNEEDFYEILYAKYQEYLKNISSMKKLEAKLGKKFTCPADFKKHLEDVRIYVRGHNLYNIFYGKYKGEKEQEILTAYINAAPRETFADILDAIDAFVYFDNRKKK